VLNEHNTVFARSGPLYATDVSLGPTEFSTQTASRALQPFLQSPLGDRPTDRPINHAIRSVTIGGALSGEAKFCYCRRSKSIYWSSRLDRSDQLQQSAAIFSCKTKRVAVYVETHYNIASKRAFPTGVPDR